MKLCGWELKTEMAHSTCGITRESVQREYNSEISEHIITDRLRNDSKMQTLLRTTIG